MQHCSSAVGAVPLLAAPQGKLQASGHQDVTSPISAVLLKCCGLHLNWFVSSNAHSKFGLSLQGVVGQLMIASVFVN